MRAFIEEVREGKGISGSGIRDLINSMVIPELGSIISLAAYQAEDNRSLPAEAVHKLHRVAAALEDCERYRNVEDQHMCNGEYFIGDADAVFLDDIGEESDFLWREWQRRRCEDGVYCWRTGQKVGIVAQPWLDNHGTFSDQHGRQYDLGSRFTCCISKEEFFELWPSVKDRDDEYITRNFGGHFVHISEDFTPSCDTEKREAHFGDLVIELY